MFNKIILIGRLGQNAGARTASNDREFTVLSVATQERWKNDKDEYETRTEWHRVYAWGKLSKFAAKLGKGQLISLERSLRYREAESEQQASSGSLKFRPPPSAGFPRSTHLTFPMIVSTTDRHIRGRRKPAFPFGQVT